MSDQGPNWEADESKQTTHLDDGQMSLKSKLSGGGRDVGEAASREETRLCPACGRVTLFVQGVCTHCDYRIGSNVPTDAPPFQYGSASEGSPAARIILIALIVLVLVAAGIFAFLKFPRHKEAAPGAETPAAQPAAQELEGGQRNAAKPPETHPGGLSAVTIDEALNNEIKDALLAGNKAWADKGVDCYVYRFGTFENTEPAMSQVVRITGYAGGKDVAAGIAAPGDEPMLIATRALLTKLNGNAGVTATLQLVSTNGEEEQGAKDIYIHYGYYYGKENWSEFKPIIEALSAAKQQNGQYPGMLDSNITRPPLTTYGGFKFKARGFGYLPIYKTDGSGNIIMGQGKGLASYQPEQCDGYYLVLYCATEGEGLDMFSPADMLQYDKTISRFPFKPEGPVKNMPLHPDGKPDGIACIVKNGELQH